MEQEIKITTRIKFDRVDAIKILFGRLVKVTQYVTVPQETPIESYNAMAVIEIEKISNLSVEQDKPTYGYIVKEPALKSQD